MKRLIKKSIWTEQKYSFDDLRGLIGQDLPSIFGLKPKDQSKLKQVLDLFEGSAKEAANATKMGMPKLEVGMVNHPGWMAHYEVGSSTLTLNTDDDQLDQTLSSSSDYIEFVGAHEYGHYVDDKLGNVSTSPEWQEVISKTNVDYLEGYGVTDNTDQNAEKFANAFVAWLWQSQDNSVTQFIDDLINGKVTITQPVQETELTEV